jgi:hypothetical protein
MQSKAHIGFTYIIETIRNGVVVDTDVVDNLIPIEGLNHMADVTFKGGLQNTTWYVGLFEGAYTPVPGDTAATFPGSATELTAYTGDRKALVLGAIADGAVDNSASKAEFTGTTNGKVATGGFVSSAVTKGATTGVLISVVRFPSPKTLNAGDVLRVTAAHNSVSL